MKKHKTCTGTNRAEPEEAINDLLKVSQSSLFDHVSRTSADAWDNLHEKVAKCFYGCNIPFNVGGIQLLVDLISATRIQSSNS